MKTVVAIALLTLSLAVRPFPSEQVQDVLAISGVTVIDVAKSALLRNMVVLTEGERIKQVGPAGMAIPSNATIVEGAGKFLIPGLADMHIHPGNGYSLQIQTLAERPNFKQDCSRFMAWGFTTVFSTSGPSVEGLVELRAESSRRDAAMPRLFGVGLSFTAKGGHASRLGTFTPDSPEEARLTVRKLKAAGVDATKLIYDDMGSVRKAALPMMTPDVMRAIIDEAHQAGLKAYVHALSLRYAKEALQAGADGLVHAVVSDPVDDEFIGLMKKNRAVYVTTHSLFYAFADIAAWAERLKRVDVHGAIPQAVYDGFTSADGIKGYYQLAPKLSPERLAVIQANLRIVHNAGIPIVSGTDTSVPGVVLGASSQVELSLLVEAGLTPAQALRAATINAAAMLGREREQGSIAAGKLADMVMLDADPLADISNLRRVNRVFKGGVAYDPARLLREAR
jgi:imidazolonepropionase-like amidohydrolase